MSIVFTTVLIVNKMGVNKMGVNKIGANKIEGPISFPLMFGCN